MTDWRAFAEAYKPRYYGFHGEPLTLDEWVELTAYRDRHVGSTRLRLRGHDYHVSTVLLGLDHAFGAGPPLIFETMVFQDDDMSVLDLMNRYSTISQARKGHRLILRALRRELREPKRRTLIHNGGKP